MFLVVPNRDTNDPWLKWVDIWGGLNFQGLLTENVGMWVETERPKKENWGWGKWPDPSPKRRFWCQWYVSDLYLLSLWVQVPSFNRDLVLGHLPPSLCFFWASACGRNFRKWTLMHWALESTKTSIDPKHVYPNMFGMKWKWPNSGGHVLTVVSWPESRGAHPL